MALHLLKIEFIVKSLHIKRTAFGKHRETKYTHQTHRDKIATVINVFKVIEEHYFIK